MNLHVQAPLKPDQSRQLHLQNYVKNNIDNELFRYSNAFLFRWFQFVSEEETGPESNKYLFWCVKAVFLDICYFAFSYSGKPSWVNKQSPPLSQKYSESL